MTRLIRTILAITTLLAAAGAARSANDTPPPVEPYLQPQTQVRLADGRRYNMVCMGHGSPVAILDASLSGWSIFFRSIQPELAKITRICAVDRAGFGFSDPGPFPRDAAAEVADLTAALEAAKLPPPYVMVGHSLGGNEVRLYAYQHPERVAGLLLIDPGIEHQRERLPYPPSYYGTGRAFYDWCAEQARAGKLVAGYTRPGDEGPCVPPPYGQRPQAVTDRLFKLVSQPARFEAIVDELDNYDTRTSAEVEKARHSLGARPIIILSSDKAHFTEDRGPGVDPDALFYAWISGHDDLAHDSTRGENRIIDGASHFVFAERPDAVITAFRDILDSVRKPEDSHPNRR